MTYIDPQELAAKERLDHAEFIERRPALQRETAVFNYNENGGLVLVLPEGDPDVSAVIKELAGIEREPAVDLKTARRRLRVARDSYQTRVMFRTLHDREYTPVFSRFVSLSAILIARAEAKHWHKVVAEQEHVARIKQQNRWAVARSHVTAI
jgi:hypothetical protein